MKLKDYLNSIFGNKTSLAFKRFILLPYSEVTGKSGWVLLMREHITVYSHLTSNIDGVKIIWDDRSGRKESVLLSDFLSEVSGGDKDRLKSLLKHKVPAPDIRSQSGWKMVPVDSFSLATHYRIYSGDPFVAKG